MRFVAIVIPRRGQTVRHEFRSPIDRARFVRDLLAATDEVKKVRYCEYIDAADQAVKDEWFEVDAQS